MSTNRPTEKIDILDKIQDGFEYLINKEDVSIRELLTDKFIQDNTDFVSLRDFLFVADIKREEDFENESIDELIKTHSRFENWDEMLIEASNQYAYRHLSE